VFVVVAVLLGRFAKSPLATREWLLVGLGSARSAWSVLLLFAAWVFALEWRANGVATVEPWVFNAVQVLLAALTIVRAGQPARGHPATVCSVHPTCGSEARCTSLPL
jgi:hypothetical protein